ncbi:MAG: hypothetical protein EBU31_11820 [Proteobacteria bacterium]|nr:hypothetical protein [Pseudomonadota bacterium]
MKFSALAISSVFAASSAFAGFIPGATQVLTASGIAGTGSYNQGTSWTVTFTFDGELAQSSLNGDFGNWTMTVTGTNGTTWSKSRSETDGGTFKNVSGGRMYTVMLGGGTDSTGSLTPTPTVLTLMYTASKTGTVWNTLGNALENSAGNAMKGKLTIANDVSGTEGVIAGAFTVPAPGAAALVGLAGLIVSRRRA